MNLQPLAIRQAYHIEVLGPAPRTAAEQASQACIALKSSRSGPSSCHVHAFSSPSASAPPAAPATPLLAPAPPTPAAAALAAAFAAAAAAPRAGWLRATCRWRR